MLACTCRDRAADQDRRVKERPHLRRRHLVISSGAYPESRNVRKPVGSVTDGQFGMVESFHRELQVNAFWWRSDVNNSPELVARLSNLDVPAFEGSVNDSGLPQDHPEYSSLPKRGDVESQRALAARRRILHDLGNGRWEFDSRSWSFQHSIAISRAEYANLVGLDLTLQKLGGPTVGR